MYELGSCTCYHFHLHIILKCGRMQQLHQCAGGLFWKMILQCNKWTTFDVVKPSFLISMTYGNLLIQHALWLKSSNQYCSSKHSTPLILARWWSIMHNVSHLRDEQLKIKNFLPWITTSLSSNCSSHTTYQMTNTNIFLVFAHFLPSVFKSFVSCHCCTWDVLTPTHKKSFSIQI